MGARPQVPRIRREARRRTVHETDTGTAIRARVLAQVVDQLIRVDLAILVEPLLLRRCEPLHRWATPICSLGISFLRGKQVVRIHLHLAALEDLIAEVLEGEVLRHVEC